jgi:hypothetical protein
VSEHHTHGRREVSLMFSGGVDSTTAAARLSESFDRVHLLSFQNGYGHYRLGRTRRRADELRARYGDRFPHRIISIQEIFERMLVDDLADTYARFGSGFVWCLGCKMAMHTRAVIYNLERGIRVMADGSSQSTGEMVEQKLISVFGVRQLYAEYGIEYRTPVYTMPRDEEIGFLERAGFRMGIRIRDRFLGVQPKCRPGELYYLPFLALNQPPRHDDDVVAAFIDEKRVQARGIIRGACRDLGLADDALPAGEA